MPSVREIAKHAGVSKSTVSLVLNEKPGVSEDMRKRVLTAIKELKERESLISVNGKIVQPNKENEDFSVVVLHPPTLRSSQVFSELLQGIQAGASRFRVQLSLVVNEPDLPDDHISRIYFSDPALRPDGVLVIGARQDIPLPKGIYDLQIPCVLVGRSQIDLEVSTVGRDEEYISYKATKYLMKLGHKAIAFVGGDPAYNYTKSRLSGYKKALESGSIYPKNNWIALGPGEEAAKEILAFGSDISAAIFINDAHFLQSIPVLQEAGFIIPEDLSVISFDDTEVARNFSPPLTSVSYPRYQEGLWSLTLLVNKIKNPLIKYSNITFRATLIERDSCVPPKETLKNDRSKWL
jgi:LacI family transcriptional regulator